MSIARGAAPDPPDEGMAARMARVAEAIMFARAVTEAAPDLTPDQLSLGTFRATTALREATAALGELLPVLTLRAEAGESVDQMLAELDSTLPPDDIGPAATMEIARTRPLVPVSLIAIRMSAGLEPIDGSERLWSRLDERLWDLEAANPELHEALSRRVAAALEEVRNDRPPDAFG